MPAQADALNDLSSMPPVSVTMQDLKLALPPPDPPLDVLPLADGVVPPPPEVPPPPVSFLLLLPQAPSSSAKAAAPAVIATPYLGRTAITFSFVRPPLASRFRPVHSRRSLKSRVTVVPLARK